VEDVSEFVFVRGGNIEDSRMANLNGQFAMIMLIGGAQDAIERISAELADLRSSAGLYVQLTPAIHTPTTDRHWLPYRLTGRALDQSGLVHKITDLLRSFEISIETMNTTLEAAPMTGAPVFSLDMILAVPSDTSLIDLRSEVARVCDALNIDWSLGAL
jgi:glycine cleavage system transcriptional repressor